MSSPVSRRVVVGGLAVAGLSATSGCSAHGLLHETTTAPPKPAQDAPLVRKAIRESQAAEAVVTTALDAHRALARELDPFLDLHEAHVRLLVRSLGHRHEKVVSDHGVFVPGTRAQAVTEVRTAEVRLAGELVALAQRALDGDLARVLASMAAALDQQLTVMTGSAS